MLRETFSLIDTEMNDDQLYFEFVSAIRFIPFAAAVQFLYVFEFPWPETTTIFTLRGFLRLVNHLILLSTKGIYLSLSSFIVQFFI
jgi:hypothetical protein